MQLTKIQQAASDAYVRGYGDTLMEFAERHERAIVAAVAAVAPLLLEEPSDDELRKVGSGRLWDAADFGRCKAVFRDRLASVTAKPDPLRKALSRWVSEADMDMAIAAIEIANKARGESRLDALLRARAK